MTIIPKALVGAVAAGAMAVVPTAASAQSRYYERDRGISVGDIIAGAVVIGGIAAVAGALGRNNDYRGDDRYYRNGNYGYYNGDPRTAVEQCVNAANRDARYRGYRSAQVTQIRSVDDTRNGWRVRGRIDVQGNDYRGGYNDRYNNRGYNDRYYNSRANIRSDSGSFTCHIDRGRVARVDYSGIRNM